MRWLFALAALIDKSLGVLCGVYLVSPPDHKGNTIQTSGSITKPYNGYVTYEAIQFPHDIM